MAEPVTRALMFRYSEWLRVERNALHEEIWPHEEPRLRQYSAFPQTLSKDATFYVPPGPASLKQANASRRAALIMSTAGADWRA
ncbi:hypothetical protein ASF22_18555 [Methylobacterium sp. Leaf87]|nr:hypothetical protein ASF22_18555 [Methylobacterium sp. Leaf87]